MQYRTEIVVPEDRYVCVLLPEYLPPGRAILTVTLTPADGDPDAPPAHEPDDRDDIEWWEEFEPEAEDAGPSR